VRTKENHAGFVQEAELDPPERHGGPGTTQDGEARPSER